MGEAADAALEGACCEGCGTWFDDVLNGAPAPGYPRLCEACQGPAPKPRPKRRRRRRKNKRW